jgi:hypothetical protein
MISKRLSIAALAIVALATILLSIFVPTSGSVNSLNRAAIGSSELGAGSLGRISASTAVLPAQPVKNAEISNLPVVELYVVKRGNTLSGIAEKFELPDWKKLYCANRETIGNKPWLLKPGILIKIRESQHVWCNVPSQSSVVGSNNSSSAGMVSLPSYGGTFSGAGFGSFQQCVIQRESGGYPQAYNTSSGASGLYGFLLSTWMSTPEGSQYPGGAYTAPISAQNAAFAWLYAKDGTAPWAPYDGC